MSKASEPIESLYHSVYESLEKLQSQVHDLNEKLDPKDPADIEKLERTQFALQLSKDVLENFVASGKSMTINYDKRSVTIEVSK
ncbi:hypothetical protein [Guptibacillus hwajinpoensis]|uniref:Uncharacterized protein (DUF4415 family) n=1 Tax=Guptibacillus hwajinpoensis TaxID=208199 RepID=A0ABU0K339_9BACL|nr:hypothetical protein [Alkalihalobacillus hemicentroti]MDQ0483770.1 uncharacterized protein (DUF4415 family) [Alkalihalobacillus hemicentroti]